MREDQEELMKKSSPKRTERKIVSLAGRNATMPPPAAIVTPSKRFGPIILVIVVKM